jgi:N-acetylmuramoyl-L-alanine amidase
MIKLQQSSSFLRDLRSLFDDLRLFFHRHRIARMIAGQVVVTAVLGVFVLNSIFGTHLFSAFAQTSCPAGSTVYIVQPGDTLGSIAATHGTSWQTLAQQNQIGNPNLIYVNQPICVPGQGTNRTPVQSQPSSSGTPQHNTVNPFPYGACTWWAAQRYHDLHGFYVPWTTNSNAFQWTARAYDFGWHVSDQPSIGAIIDFQPGVEYASSSGHVGVVEQILSNGDVVTSNMNVAGYSYGSVVNLTFHTGPGVTFITA